MFAFELFNQILQNQKVMQEEPIKRMGYAYGLRSLALYRSFNTLCCGFYI